MHINGPEAQLKVEKGFYLLELKSKPLKSLLKKLLGVEPHMLINVGWGVC